MSERSDLPDLVDSGPKAQLLDDAYCLTCDHKHIPTIPVTTFRCAECGFGSWGVTVAAAHAESYSDHLVYPVLHQMVAARVEQARAGEGALREARDEGLAAYLAQMDRAGGGIYTADFRSGFRHALAMLAAYESTEEPLPDRARPEVREAARLALARRAALTETGARRYHSRDCMDADALPCRCGVTETEARP